MGLFTAHGIRDLLGILNCPLAKTNLFTHHRLLIDVDLLLADWYTVCLTSITNGSICRYLARDRMPLNIHFFAIDRHVHGLLLFYHILANTDLAGLNPLFVDLQLLFLQLELLLTLISVAGLWSLRICR